eukprot:6470344-Amphidinium_carterae.1
MARPPRPASSFLSCPGTSAVWNALLVAKPATAKCRREVCTEASRPKDASPLRISQSLDHCSGPQATHHCVGQHTNLHKHIRTSLLIWTCT